MWNSGASVEVVVFVESASREQTFLMAALRFGPDDQVFCFDGVPTVYTI